jgi:hypothetical protein
MFSTNCLLKTQAFFGTILSAKFSPADAKIFTETPVFRKIPKILAYLPFLSLLKVDKLSLFRLFELQVL